MYTKEYIDYEIYLSCGFPQNRTGELTKAFSPDLAECYGEGETLDEAIEEANEAAYNWISLELDEDDCQLPPVSDEDDLELEDGDIVRNISVNIRFYEGWMSDHSCLSLSKIYEICCKEFICLFFLIHLPVISNTKI